MPEYQRMEWQAFPTKVPHLAIVKEAPMTADAAQPILVPDVTVYDQRTPEQRIAVLEEAVRCLSRELEAVVKDAGDYGNRVAAPELHNITPWYRRFTRRFSQRSP